MNLISFAVCVPLTCDCGCAHEILGECVAPCLKWSKCCFKIPDPICVLYNEGCAIIRAVVEKALSIAKSALFIAEDILLEAEGVVRGLQFVVDQARFVLDAIVAVLEMVKLTVTTGLKASKVITRFLSTGIINIMEIGFNVNLAVFSHGRISAYIDVSYFGQSPIRLSVILPIFNPLALVGDLAEKAIPGIVRNKRRFRKRMDKVFM